MSIATAVDPQPASVRRSARTTSISVWLIHALQSPLKARAELDDKKERQTVL